MLYYIYYDSSRIFTYSCLADCSCPELRQNESHPSTQSTIQGYPLTYNTSIYTGYLDLKSTERGAHYVFV